MPKGTVLKGQSRQFVRHLQDYFEKEFRNGAPLLPMSQVRNRVAAALGISVATVTKIAKEAYGSSGIEQNKVSTPKKKRQPCKVTCFDDFDADAIRRHIYEYYQRKEIPTLRRLVISLRNSGLFRGQKSSLGNVLRQIGFYFKKSDKRKILLERHDIALARCDFLRKAKQIEDWSNVVFTDETWLNANHSISKSWTDDTAASTSAVPIGKGERLIICHAGTAKGFVADALLAFKSKKSGDYHEEMNAEIYENWFREMLMLLEEPSIIFIDNAPYHSRQINKMPTQANTKHEIINWLRDNGEDVNNSFLKAELIRVLKSKRRPKRYVVDEIGAEYGHTVIRIPPYHCQYNAIELIWAQIKGKAARNNTTPPFTANKMMQLLNNACNEVTPENWASVVERTRKIIMSDWDRDVTIDSIKEQELIIHVTEDSSDESSVNYEEESDALK
ncbi:unnamed protein product [Euphydryas editha]|uniref:Tc1-like transposase DDE domain-containing protein n=1 Tax=Euphydryas editha TaxID=104508 RepID=A0AAU9UF50_EUPED|nr:unnamed protein product [Euphydryas editha]